MATIKSTAIQPKTYVLSTSIDVLISTSKLKSIHLEKYDFIDFFCLCAFIVLSYSLIA